jgi:hypothetical protein
LSIMRVLLVAGGGAAVDGGELLQAASRSPAMRARCAQDAGLLDHERGTERRRPAAGPGAPLTRRGHMTNPCVSKAALRTSMHVVTLFTGAAALAVAFAPTANAQAAGKSAFRPAPRLAKDLGIRSGACSGVPSWVHVYYSGGGATCFGYQGVESIISPGAATGFCGGNNSGYLSGLTESGRHLRQGFGSAAKSPSSIYYFAPPRFPGDVFYVSKVHISRWSGNRVCPSF